MAYFPFLIDIEGKKCVIVGGGSVAFRKAEMMISFGAEVMLVAPDICNRLELLDREKNKLIICRRIFREDDLQEADIVIAATNDEEVNTYISGLCYERKILINVVDVKEECSFIFPAVIKRENMLIAVSSGGNSPAATTIIKKKIEENFPDYYGKMTKKLGNYREYIKKNVMDAKDRKALYYELVEYGDIHEGEITDDYIESLIQKYATGREPHFGK